jgi:hypothetical protein
MDQGHGCDIVEGETGVFAAEKVAGNFTVTVSRQNTEAMSESFTLHYCMDYRGSFLGTILFSDGQLAQCNSALSIIRTH